MEYFYTPPALIHPPSLQIEGDEFSHLTHVMRKKPGDTLRIVDGCGNMYEAVLETIVRRSAHCRITHHAVRTNEPDIEVTLAVGLLKSGSNFDFLVEKAVEIGVRNVVPLLTERSIPKQAKTDRWQKIALSAMKQSGRCVLTAVQPLSDFRDFLRAAPDRTRRFIPHEKISQPLLRAAVAAENRTTTIICIGPEGGFSDEEITLAAKAGFIPVGLGPRRLRTETAAIVAATIVLQ